MIVAIHLPTKPHTLHPVSNGGVFVLREWSSEFESMPSSNRRPRFNTGNDWDSSVGPVRSNQLKDHHSPKFNADPSTIESDGPGYVSPLEAAVVIDVPERLEIRQPSFAPQPECTEPWSQSWGTFATRNR